MHIAKKAHFNKELQQEKIDPIDLFAAYHLGLQLDGSVAFYNGPQVAAEFSVSLEVLEEVLNFYEISSEHLVNTDFDLVGARIDMEYSPDGADLWANAQMHFENYVSGSWQKRDWNETD